MNKVLDTYELKPLYMVPKLAIMQSDFKEEADGSLKSLPEY